MNMKKSLLTLGIVTGITVVSLAGAGLVSAATPGNGQDNLVDKIATKFHLKKADVKAVFDEDHAARQAERQKAEDERLSQAVTDGKITSTQKDLITAKLKEIQTDRKANKDSMKDKTEAERKATMDAKRTELEQWAKDNGMSMEYLHPMGHRGPGGMGGPGGMEGPGRPE